jgi:hypothetical protein
MQYNQYQQGDRVKYSGEKHKKELKDDFGFVSSRVLNQDDTYVVDFSEDSLVVHASLLSRYHFVPGKNEHAGPEVRRRKHKPASNAAPEKE